MSAHILILGAGFAALTAIRELRRRLPDARLSVIAPQAEFTYLPSLIWIPTGLRSGAELRVPLHAFFQRQRVDFIAARVRGLQADGHTVETDAGPVSGDALVIASGGRFLRKLPGIEHADTLCEGIRAAEHIRDTLHALRRGRIAIGFGANPQEPSAVRGGPMFELLFGIDRWLRREGRRRDIDLVFFNPSRTPGQRLGEQAVQGLLREMRQRGISTHLGHKLLAFSPEGVDSEGGHIPADAIFFMPGLTGPDWLDNSPLPRSAGGFVQATPHCQVPGFEHIFVAGDAGSYPGPDWMPKQAHMADLQARAVAENLSAQLRGQTARAEPRVELLCIIDSLDRGALVYRSPTRSLMLPANRPLHWAKRAFERWYLKGLR